MAPSTQEQPTAGEESIDGLLEQEALLLEQLYADSTKSAKSRTRKKVISFNKKHYGHMGDSVLEVPIFWDTQTVSGKFVSAARNASIFFAGNAKLKQATLVSMKSHLKGIYSWAPTLGLVVRGPRSSVNECSHQPDHQTGRTFSVPYPVGSFSV
jgi:hypothetical protein